MSEVAIRTDVYQPNIVGGENTGLAEYVRQRTYKEVLEQFKAVLMDMNVPQWGHSAFNGVEYISFEYFDQDSSVSVPKGYKMSPLFVLIPNIFLMNA